MENLITPALLIPSIEHAEAILNEAEALNPGPWVIHSRNVARAASLIADGHPGMDAQATYILGLLHDIGRRQGASDMRHILDGYRYLDGLGFPDAARFCLTHSYPNKIAAEGAGAWDGTDQEYQFVQAYLDGIEYTAYDRLIQLCDSISLPGGFCLMEKRPVDVALRYGFNEHTISKWKAFFKIKTEFENVIGGSIYNVLPDVIETTFKA